MLITTEINSAIPFKVKKQKCEALRGVIHVNPVYNLVCIVGEMVFSWEHFMHWVNELLITDYRRNVCALQIPPSCLIVCINQIETIT